MAGSSVPIFVESRYRVNRRKIAKCVRDELHKHGVDGEVEVSVAIVGKRKMHELNKKYRNLDKPTNVLSFCQQEGESVPHSGNVMMLGDVVVCYPIAVDNAARENMLVDDKICELVEHSVRHLLGFHHS